jgi:hypothetical protein
MIEQGHEEIRMEDWHRWPREKEKEKEREGERIS